MKLNDYQKQYELERIEHQLQPLVKKKDKSWIEVYRLLEIVEKEMLYTVSYSSYTAWLTDFAERANVTVSLLWKKKKAGKFYSSYTESRQYQNKPYVPLEKSNMDPEVIVMIEKITAGNLAEAHKMIDRSRTGKITRGDLKTLWESEKKERAKKGIPIQRANAYDKQTFTDLSYVGYASKDATNIDILSALCNHRWMSSLTPLNESGKYRLLTEFSIIRNDLETDYIVIENCTAAKNPFLFNLHSIKIVCERSDFRRKAEFKTYPEYMDYYWLAVPVEYQNEAVNWLTDYPDIGLILYDEFANQAFIHKAAANHSGFGIKRNDTMDSVAYYLL